ncbi:MAG: POTRA domain-containing protein [Pseudomonadota bacterium]
MWAVACTVRADVVIGGIDGELLDNVRAYIGLTDASCELGNGAVAAAAERVPRDALAALEALGFYNASVTVTQSRAPECWRLDVNVRAGQPARYLEISVMVDGPAKADAAVQAVIAAAPLPGDAVHHGRYSAYKRRLAQVLADRGYLTAERTVAEVRVDEAGVSAALQLAYQSGPRYRLGEIRVVSDAYDEALVQRFITLEPGMPFDSTLLAKTQRELASSALFSEASVRAVYAEADAGTVPVAIELTAVEKLGYFVGAGASTDRGPRLRGGYRNRRVNAQGHQLELDILGSQGLSRFGARYRTPLANPLRGRSSRSTSLKLAERMGTSKVASFSSKDTENSVCSARTP